MLKDELFKNKLPFSSFTFNKDVASVFDDMLQRSIPLYPQTLQMLVSWAKNHYEPGTPHIDLGCSTGNLIELLAKVLPEGSWHQGIDPSPDMIDLCTLKLSHAMQNHKIELFISDALDFSYQGASVISSMYTIQFINPALRKDLLKRIYQELRTGGLFWISEKITFGDRFMQKKIEYFYDKFKSDNGYSDEEIVRKKKSLEGVLIPMSYEHLYTSLREAGFSHVIPVIQWQNFVSFAAIK